MTKINYYICFLLLASFTVLGQQKQVHTSIDSTKIKIGSQFNLTLKTTVDAKARVNFPEGKNFGLLEVLESYPVDTIKNDGRYELVKKYGLTQFDSGRYVIPPLPVIINNKNFTTDSLTIEVTNVVVDTLKQKMFDIKPVAEVKSESNIWWYLVILAGLAAVGGLIYWDIKRRRNKVKPELPLYSSPIEKAAGELKRLESKQLLQKGAVKDYYSELTGIVRTYIEEAVHIPAKESTTGGLLIALQDAMAHKKLNLNSETLIQLQKVLSNADFVKFAKMQPPEGEIAEDRMRIAKAIEDIDKAIPEEVEEDITQTEAWKELQLKKKKQRRNAIIIGACAFVLLGSLFFYGFTKTFTFLKDNVIGHPTKELWEGEWVKSEYGNPPIEIATPKVLKRENLTGKMPKEAMAAIQEMQMFSYGAMYSNFYVMIATTKYKQPRDTDFNSALEGVIKQWELQGATNILVKQEGYQTEKGTEGMRAYGTLSMPDPVTKEKKKAYYEIFFFKQEQGLQQIVILHEDQDEYGIRILEKIKKSIRFGKVR
jgi:hypothetical protein